ncbi:MAG: Gfo/Idh/MocA family oxidoreductase [Caldilineaceae bacterium]
MTYRVGLIGARRGSSLVRPFESFPETQITALCDLDEARLAATAKALEVDDQQLFTRYEDLLAADIDVVVIGTPIQFHAAQAIQALEAGKHVLSEVTAAYSLEDCQRLVDTAQRTGQLYMMAENACYFHFIRQWRDWIGQGRLGNIFYAESEYIHNIQHLLRDEQSGESFWRIQRPPIYYCSHSLGPLLMLMDDRIVQAMGLATGFGIMPDLGPGCLNMEVALFKTAKGAVIKLLRSQVAYREPPMHFYSLYGTKGSVENDRAGGHQGVGQGKLYVHGEQDPQHGFAVIDCPISDPDAPVDALGGGHGTTEYYLVRDFITALQQGSPPPIDAMRAAEFTAPGICAHESALRGGTWVEVPQYR